MYLNNSAFLSFTGKVNCGGTGSQVLTALARINHTLVAIGHPGLHVTAFDPDHVSDANLGRQLFSISDAGVNKAIVLTSRINRFFGVGWEAVPDFYEYEPSNILITCTDTVKSRIDIAKKLLKSIRISGCSLLTKKTLPPPLYTETSLFRAIRTGQKGAS